MSDFDSDYDSDEDTKKKNKELKSIVDDLEKEKVEEKQPDSRWARAKAAVKEWGEEASTHGIPHMAQATTCIAVIVWGIILAVCAVAFVYLFSNTLKQYLAFDKIVDLTFGIESANFPSLTFCNINPYKMSEIQNVPELKALLTVYEFSLNGSLST